MFSFLVRMKNGLVMTGISVKYIFKKPGLLFFPLLRIALASIIYPLLILAFIGSLAMLAPIREYGEIAVTAVSILLASLFLILALFLFFLILLFSSVAAIHYLFSLFQNEKPSIRSSLVMALRRFPNILIWSGIQAGILFIIMLIRGDKEESSTWRKLLGGTLDIGWRIATYFVPPIIAQEHRSIRATVTESAQLMKQRFGEVVGVAASFNALATLIFPGIIMIMISIMNYLYDSGSGKELAIDFYKYPHAYYILIITFIITVSIRAFISSAQDIFKTAAFNFAHDKPTGPFPPALIEENFEQK